MFKTQSNPNDRNRPLRGGFSFAEVMFAVIILGIGFIMVAAIFPVAIQQTKLTVDETGAAAVAKQAVNLLEQVAANSDSLPGGPLFPKTNPGSTVGQAQVYAIRNWPIGQQQPGASLPDEELWNRTKGSLINQIDPRFAWTALFSRDVDPVNTAVPASYARAYVFVLRATDRSTFSDQDFNTASRPANLQPRLVRVTVEPAAPGTPDPDTIVFTEPQDLKYTATGAFLVIADAPPAADAIGRIYRLGTLRGANNDLYEVDPAYDVPDGAPYSAAAWIVGRSFTEPLNDPDPPTAGPAMDVSMYVTFLKMN